MATRRKSRLTLPLMCSGRVTAWESTVSLAKGSPHSGDVASPGSRCATLAVELLEPIKGRTTADIVVMEQSAERSGASIRAHITSMGKSAVHVQAIVTGEEMSGLLALATCNRLKSCLLAYEEPIRGRAAITALRVGTQEPEVLG